MIYLKEGASALNLAYDDEIIQEANSTYQLSFKFPTNHFLCEKLVEETLLLADDLHGEQEFIIFEIEKHHGFISVYANQVATLLNNFSISELSVNNASGDRVFRSLVSSITREHPFTFFSDIASTHVINLKNMSVANALFKDKHSIMGQWGGDLVRDKYSIKLLSNGGNDKEAIFMYKKNLKGYQHKKSIKDLKTRIHFFKTLNSNKEGEEEKTIEVTVDSPLINKYQNIFEGNLEVNDQDVVDIKSLQEYGINYFKNTLCDVLEENIEIDVIGCSDVPINIFDTVSIFYENFNLDIKKKITSYKFSPMGKKLKSIGFGKIQGGLGTTLSSMINEAVEQKVETSVDAFKIQKNLAGLLKKDRQAVEEKIKDLTEQAKAGVEVKRALFEEDGNVPDVFKTKVLDSVEADIARLKTIITEAEMIKAIQAQLDFGEIKTALIDKAFIKQILSDETFKQEFEEGEVTTQNIFAKMRDSIQSNIKKEFLTKDETRKLVTDLTIGADGIRQITQDESKKVFKNNVVAFKNDINNDIDSKIKSNDDKLRNEIGSSIGNIYDDLNKKNYELGQKQDKDIQSLKSDVDKKIDGNRRILNSKMDSMTNNFKKDAENLLDYWQRSSDDINNELKNVDGKIAGAINEMNGKAEKLAYDINKSASGLRSEFNSSIDDKTNKLKGDINSNASKIDVNIKKIELIERDTKKFREFSSTIDEFKSKIGQIEKNKFEITTESKNLCAETGERKKGNDLYFNTSETLKANKEYYILANADGVNGDEQWTKIFNANLKWLDFFDANYRNDSKILVNGLNVWKVSYDHDVTQVNIYPCGSGTYISKVRIYEASKSEDKKNLYVSHKISSDGSNEKLKTIEFKVSEKLQYGEIYAIEFNSEVQFKYYIINNDIYNTTYINNSATIMSGENGCYFEEKHQDGTFSVDMAVSMLEDSELKLYGDVKIYKSNIKNTTKSGLDVINEISSQIRQTKSEIDLTVKKNNVINSINISSEGTRIHGGAIVDVLEGKEIVGGVIRGNYRMEIGDTGYMYPCYNYDVSGLVMKIPHKGGASGSGIVCQFNGNPRTQAAGEFSYYPYGLYIYRCENGWNRVNGNDSYILHVDGFVNARGVGGLRFTKDNDGDNNLWCIGSFQNEHKSVRLEFGGGGNDIYYKSSNLRYSLWDAMTNALSDVRYKTNIKKSDVDCLDIVNKLKFYSFDWAKGKDPCRKKEPFEVGMIAQDVERIDNNFVYDNDGVKFVDTYRMLNVALKAIQELSGKVARLESECKGA